MKNNKMDRSPKNASSLKAFAILLCAAAFVIWLAIDNAPILAAGRKAGL